MATRPLLDDSAGPLPMDRLLLAEELLDLAERAQMHTSATGSAIVLQRGEKLVIRTSSGMAPAVGTSLPKGEGTIGQCASSGKPIHVSEEDKMDAALLPLEVRSLIAVPIHHAGLFYGVLVALAQSPEAFTRMHVAIMMTLANEVARVLKRLDAAMDFAPGTPLRAAPAPVATLADTVVTITLPEPKTPTAPQNIIETLKAIEHMPPPPVKFMAAPSLSPKLTPSTETKAPAPSPAQRVAAMSLIELEPAQSPPPPLPGLLCPGEDPRPHDTLKTAESLAPKPTFALTSSYPRPAGSAGGKALVVAVLVIAAAAYGMWRYGKTLAAAHQAVSAAGPAAGPVVATVPTPKIAMASPAAPSSVTTSAQTPTAKKPSEAKEDGATPRLAPEAALRIAPAPEKTGEATSVEAPSLAFPAATGMPELPAPKLPAAALAVKRSVASPAAVLRTVAPIYPEFARQSGTYGEVRLQLTVSPAGKVTGIRALDGPPVLLQAATNAVRQWQYRAATLDGRAIESTVDVTVKFGPR